MPFLVVGILAMEWYHMVLLLVILDDLMFFSGSMNERNIYRVKSSREIVPREQLLAPHLIYARV